MFLIHQSKFLKSLFLYTSHRTSTAGHYKTWWIHKVFVPQSLQHKVRIVVKECEKLIRINFRSLPDNFFGLLSNVKWMDLRFILYIFIDVLVHSLCIFQRQPFTQPPSVNQQSQTPGGSLAGQ